jgi:mRNA interferase HigB
MHIISRKKLVEFGKKHAAAVTPLDDWYRIVKRKTYHESQALKADFRTVDFLSGNRVVFDIGGNKYRLVARIHYGRIGTSGRQANGRVFVRHVLTHAEYDRLTKAARL